MKLSLLVCASSVLIAIWVASLRHDVQLVFFRNCNSSPIKVSCVPKNIPLTAKHTPICSYQCSYVYSSPIRSYLHLDFFEGIIKWLVKYSWGYSSDTVHNPILFLKRVIALEPLHRSSWALIQLWMVLTWGSFRSLFKERSTSKLSGYENKVAYYLLSIVKPM